MNQKIWLVMVLLNGGCSHGTPNSAASATPDQEARVIESKMVDEGQFVLVNGVHQWVTIRGVDRHNPVLFVVGGAGVALSRMAPFFAPWESRFTVVHWDQPGTGTAHGVNGEADTNPLTLARIIEDGIVVANFVRTHLAVKKVVLVAYSSGSIVGLQMVKRRPELFAAYVGTGQVVDWVKQDSLSYSLLMERARANGDSVAIRELEHLGPPPYRTTEQDAIKSKYAAALTADERQVFAALDPTTAAALRMPPLDATYVPKGLSPFDPRQQASGTYAALREQITSFNAWALGPTFDLPLFFFQGERDQFTVTSEVERFASDTKAPMTKLVTIRGGGHSAVFLRDEFLSLLERDVRPLAIAAEKAQP